ncbi:NADPH-dependent 1-acyldihydroxyacetone phosphate reductase [Daldinia childiae]|uniref:NADPH-dependent 1-acyldihydroxyacetone phosphate reductase n=1 Tax=Daldinia childiae TaxID=326645 RepID=UPI001444A7D3|nr:NADPH-dependent 1-acyldihydroxyacetone phosphate reductase [Daldinia childiae]KAF3070856.1 NADPH-dependent 1-acyldihydroxyacetone phosphate reductase [Daldinia childiae]
MVSQQRKTALITGCSEGGIGHALVKEFQARGLHVFATARSVSKMSSLGSLPHVTLLPLDVTSSESLAAAAAAVSAETSGKLDFLVNNAGQQIIMPLLDFDMAQAKAMYDVNVFGAAAAVQAFAPLLIAAKGTIVNMTSITGLMYPPYMSFYAGTKSSLISISEGMRLELKPFGVKVATIIVGAVHTNIFANAPEHKLPPNSLYKGAEKEIAARATGQDVGERLGTREDFSRELVGKLLRGASGRLHVGNMSTMIRIMTTWFPTCVVDYLTVANTGLDHLP